MQSLKIASNETLLAPPQGQPDLPGDNPKPLGSQGTVKPIPPAQGTISEKEILQGVEGTKISTLTPMNDSGTNTGQMGQMGSSVPVGGLVDGKLAVELMDALLPSLIVAIMAMIGAQMKKTDMQLTAKEKSTIEPLMQKCMDQLMINFQSPFAALGVSLIVIYGAKVTEHGVIQIIDKKAEKAARERERKAKQSEVKTNAAPVINMDQKPAQSYNGGAPVQTSPTMPEKRIAKPISLHWEPSDEQIFEGLKRVKTNRHELILRLKREHAAGTLETFFKRKILTRK